jgi:hypothetical protein
MKDVETLRQTVNDLERQLSNLVLENNELKTINVGFGAAVGDANETMRSEARSMFVGGLRSGALNDALSQMNAMSEMDVLKSKAKDTLSKASKDGQLRDTLQWINEPKVSQIEEVDPVMTLRVKCRDDLLAAAKDGRLGNVLNIIKPVPSIRAGNWASLLIDSSFSTYYKRHACPSINKDAWATIHSRFQQATRSQEAKKIETLSDVHRSIDKDAWATIHTRFQKAKQIETQSEVQRVDEDSINVLNMELEQLAKDRAKLLEQVNMIRSLMVDVAADNNRLAQEVLNRPVSTEAANMVLTRSLTNLV